LAVLVGLGAEGALTYMVYANFAYLIVAYAYTLTVVLSVTRKSERRFEFFTTVRKMVAFGAPIGFSNSYNGFAGQVVNLTVARFVNLNTYGLYSVATTASGFISYVSDPIKTMLLPAYSRIAGLKDSNLMKMLSIQTTRYESAIILPVTLFFMVFAGPFVTSLYGAQYADAGIMLTLIAATFLPIGLGFDAMSTFLTSGGFTRFIGGVGVVSSSTIMLIAVLVVPWFGLLGFLVASIFNFILPYALVTSKARRELGLSPPVTQVRHFYSSLVLTGMASGAIILLPLPSFASVLIGLGVVPFCFVAFSALLRAIEPADFDRLRSMISTQSVVPRLIGPLIEVSERLVRFLRGE
jgi:O-antigen/teichoic acid export membrane protein